MEDERPRRSTENRKRYDRLRPGIGKQTKETTRTCSERCLDRDPTSEATSSRSRSPSSHRGILAPSDCSRLLFPTSQCSEVLETKLANRINVRPFSTPLNLPGGRTARALTEPPNAAISTHEEDDKCPSLHGHNTLRKESNDDIAMPACPTTDYLSNNRDDSARRDGNSPPSDSCH
ncbi:hypothetical protein CDL15_Pgr018512 [Punica granatum]|uniref:Uncharacterized protein n=1 Tax=Punica granatum TaxID=22663 RepID=A0A218WZ72_PUNGR|nr:hypothetical protein CDL15_Pgr018512 [Punica granatum]